MSKHKFNIFSDVLNRIDRKEFDHYSKLEPSDQRSIAPLVTMRWMSGVKNEQQVMMLNEFVNPYIFNMYTHPDLLWRLMCVCSPGKTTRYQWKKVEKKTSNMAIEVIKKYYNYSTREATDSLKLLAMDDIVQCAHELGYDGPQRS
jgi:hypothetical protein